MTYYTVNNGKKYIIKDYYKGILHCALLLDKRNHEKLILELQDTKGKLLEYDQTSKAIDILSSYYIGE